MWKSVVVMTGKRSKYSGFIFGRSWTSAVVGRTPVASKIFPRVEIRFRGTAFQEEDRDVRGALAKHLRPQVGQTRELLRGDAEPVGLEQHAVDQRLDAMPLIRALRRLRRDVRPRALLRHDVTLALEVAVDSADRVVVHAERPREKADGWQPVARLPRTHLDVVADLLRELRVNRQRLVAVDVKFDGHD